MSLCDKTVQAENVEWRTTLAQPITCDVYDETMSNHILHTRLQNS